MYAREILRLVDDGVKRNHDDVTVTSPVITSSASVAIHFQSSAGSHRVIGRWPLVDKQPGDCCWIENNMADVNDYRRKMNDAVDVSSESRPQQQQQRQPLTILFGSPMTSTLPVSARPSVVARPWRPFSVHEDRPISPSPSPSTAAGELRGPTVAAAESTVDEVDPADQQLHTTTVGQQYTAADFLPVIPFVPVLPDGLYSHIAIDQLRHQRLLSSVRQQVVDGGFLYPTVVTGYGGISTARQQCSKCGVGFSTLGDLVRHQQLPCQTKSSSLSPESGISGSPPTRSPSPLLSCPHCDKTYTSSGALKMHVRTHTLPCRCPTCGKAFSRPWLLQGHLRTHTGERPFSCGVCGRAFADRSNLRAHAQTHAAAKRYQCTACRRSFSRLSLLVRHEHHTASSGCCSGRHGNEDAARPISDDRQK